MSDAFWFDRLARTVREIIDESGGAAVMTRQAWAEAARQEDPGLARCPQRVFEHMACALSYRQGLKSVRWHDDCAAVLLIFDPAVHADPRLAREHCERYGLSDEVIIALADAGAMMEDDAFSVA